MEELSPMQKDTISEVGNICLGAAATALSVILDKFVDITTPELTVMEGDEVRQKYPVPCLLVEVDYISGLRGNNILLIKEQDALVIAALMMGEDPAGKEGPLNEIELSAVQEAMNQMMGSMATSMSDLFQSTIEISSPKIKAVNMAEEEPDQLPLEPLGKVVHVKFNMKVEDLIDSIMVQVIPLDFAGEMTVKLLGEEPDSAPAPQAGVQEDLQAGSVPGEEERDEEEAETIVIDSGESAPGELTELEKDTISEVGNISLGASATALSTLLDKVVEITTPKLDIRKVKELQEEYPVPCLLVKVEYTAGLEGSNILFIKEQDALVIASLMMGEEPGSNQGPLSEIEQSAVQEAMNQMMGSMATSMSELFQRTIDISPPSVDLIDLSVGHAGLYSLEPDDTVVMVEFNMKVENIIDSIMVQVIPIEFAKKMSGYLLYGEHYASGPLEVDYSTEAEEVSVDTSPAPAAQTGEPGYERDPSHRQEAGPTGTDPGKRGRTDLDIDWQKLELVRDIPMDIMVILGTARVPLGQLFSMDKGGVLDLECSVNDPVTLMANDRLLAKGEVVMVNNQLGVRITEIQFEEVMESYGM